MPHQTDQTTSHHGLQSIDEDTLSPLVRRDLNRPRFRITDWVYQPVHGGASDEGAGLSGIYRFEGSGLDEGQAITWSLILKVIGARYHGGDPDGGYREHRAYHSGILNQLSGCFIAARCYAVVEREDEVYWLWLEDVADSMQHHWTLERYGVVANHLGQFNGTFVAGVTPLEWPWLSRNWLRALLAPNAAALTRLGDYADHPLVRRQFPKDVIDGLLRLWADHERFLAAIDQLPQTLCHRDAWSRNLFVRHDDAGREQTVAIDWAFVGLGAVGEEIAPLVQTRNFFAPGQAQELDALVFNNYLQGLRTAGWDGDPTSVRFAYTASSAMRYGLGFVASWLDTLLDFNESKAVWVKQVFGGLSIEGVADRFSGQYRGLLKLADEARVLLGESA